MKCRETHIYTLSRRKSTLLNPPMFSMASDKWEETTGNRMNNIVIPSPNDMLMSLLSVTMAKHWQTYSKRTQGTRNNPRPVAKTTATLPPRISRLPSMTFGKQSNSTLTSGLQDWQQYIPYALGGQHARQSFATRNNRHSSSSCAWEIRRHLYVWITRMDDMCRRWVDDYWGSVIVVFKLCFPINKLPTIKCAMSFWANASMSKMEAVYDQTGLNIIIAVGELPLG